MATVTLVSSEIFKHSEICGVFGGTLSAPAAKLIGRALAAEAREKGVRKIALSWGGKRFSESMAHVDWHRFQCSKALAEHNLSSPVLAMALADGLCYGGITVLCAGESPTFYYDRRILNYGALPEDRLSFPTMRCNRGNGVAVTGSHPPEYSNSIRIMLGGKLLEGESMRAFCDRVDSRNYVARKNGPGPPYSYEGCGDAYAIAELLPQFRKTRG